MKIVASLLLVAMLTGCGFSVGVKRTFPDAPPSLKTECPDLELVTETSEKLSELLTVVNSNYAKYHTCREKVTEWISWHAKQKEIFDKVK